MMKVPIILLNYNSSADCAKCISFLKQQQEVEIEIVVVDNCSSREEEHDAIRQLCEEQGCTFIQAEKNRGYNAGNNIGLRYVANKGYKFALIANPDMEFLQEHYVAKMVAKMEEDEDIVVCGSDIVSPEGRHENPMKRDGDWKNSFEWLTYYFRNRQKVNSTKYEISNSKYCFKVSGCCLMVRMSFITNIGYFDQNVFLYCEEAILSRQVEQNKKRMYYLAETQAIHNHIKSEKGNPKNRFKAWISSRIYFEKKYNNEGWLKNAIKTTNLQIYGWLFILRVAIKKR